MTDSINDTGNKFNVPTDKPSDSVDKTLIGGGKTLSDLKKESASKLTELDKSTKKAETTKSTVVEKEVKTNHSDNLVKLLAPYFDNSRQRALAQVQIENYFKENKL